MKISTKAASVRHAASRDMTRQNLNCVLVEEDGACVATNGYMLLRAKANGAEAGERACLGLSELEAERKVAKARKSDAVDVPASTDVRPDNFPNWRAVAPAPLGNLPVADDAKQVTLDVNYLEAICKAAREFHGGKARDLLMIRFTVQGELDPVAFEVKAPDSGEFAGVVMPVRP